MNSMDFPANQIGQTSVTHPERRTYPRFPVKVQIELYEEGSDVPIHSETTDLSRGGCYVQLSLTLALGAYVHGRLWINSSPIRFRGRVVTRHPEFGNGLMFLELEGSGEQILAAYLDAIV